MSGAWPASPSTTTNPSSSTGARWSSRRSSWRPAAPPPIFISVWGGKEPLLSWFTGLGQGIFGMVEPELAGRLPALLSGAGALAALVVVGRWLFAPGVAYLAGLFYLLWPFALLFHVQLQPDSLLTGEIALMLLATLAILRGGGWLPVAGLALAFAAAMLTKSSALLYLVGLPALLLARPGAHGQSRSRVVGRLAIAVLAGYLIYFAVFGRTPYAADVAEYNSIYVLPISELLFLPLDQWLAYARFLFENALDLLGV
ncbi:MAG: glycosyltransferase family 39 protein, partial [Chloroflexi bacterium]|nr:glycosyltransferase family 39 protein [Chloroflexota bacterium]